MTSPKRRLPVGNPAKAPAVYGSLWKRGGAARAGVAAWLISFIVALSVGVLIGVARDHHFADRRLFGSMAAGLGGLAVCLVLLGTYLAYRGTGGFPRGWADDR
jgi:hypothetical protein